MYKLKLIRGRSYHGVVTATNQKPIILVEDEATAKQAVASGYFEIVEKIEKPAAPSVPPVPPAPPTDITKMNSGQLDEFAKASDIDLSGQTNRDKKLAEIQRVLAEREAAKTVNENSGDGDEDADGEGEGEAENDGDGEQHSDADFGE